MKIMVVYQSIKNSTALSPTVNLISKLTLIRVSALLILFV